MNMKVLVTGIIADQPTANLNIYPKEVLEAAIKQFNMRAAKKPIRGGVIDPLNIDMIGEETHETTKLFLNESGMLCAEVEILDTDAGCRLNDSFKNNTSIVARPIMCVPSYVDIAKKEPKTDPLRISKLNSIVRVQVELDEPKNSNG